MGRCKEYLSPIPWLLTACLAAFSLAVRAQTVVDDADPDATRVAREQAADLAISGTPERSAALRATLAAAGRALIDDRGRRRVQSLSMQPSPSAVPNILAVDSDRRYQNWLDRQPAVFQLRALGQPRRGARSIGGHPVESLAAFDEVTALIKTRKGTICSGVLVERKTVLTAAHCLCAQPELVYIGLTSPRDRFDRNNRVFAIAKRVLPTGIDVGTDSCKADQQGVEKRKGKDVGVIVLKGTGVGASLVKIPAHLSSDAELATVQEGQDIYAVGFGRMGFTGATGVKNWVRVPVLSPACSSADVLRYGCVEGKEMVSLRHDSWTYGPWPLRRRQRRSSHGPSLRRW